MLAVVLAAVRLTAPVPADRLAELPPDCRAAWVDVSETFNANEPATPVPLALAPEVDSAAKLCVVSPPTSFIDAAAVMPSEVTVASVAITA